MPLDQEQFQLLIDAIHKGVPSSAFGNGTFSETTLRQIAREECRNAVADVVEEGIEKALRENMRFLGLSTDEQIDTFKDNNKWVTSRRGLTQAILRAGLGTALGAFFIALSTMIWKGRL